MVNYDIPWNPARLEQRMGRIHRYGQKHDVRVVNLVAGGTREGRVLKVLLDKLEFVRRTLSSDKVFDVIGSLLENTSLREFMIDALTDEGERRVLQRIERSVTDAAVSGIVERQAKVYGAAGEIAPRLSGMRQELDRERYLHLLPAYVRLFVESAADKLGIGIQGDLDGVFSLEPVTPGALDALLPALEGYPHAVRDRLRIRRPGAGEACIWLHPGEPVFDALCSRVVDALAHHARRGAIFIDPRADEAGLWHLAALSVEDDSSGVALGGDSPNPMREAPRPVLERRLLALRQGPDESVAEISLDALLALHCAPGVAPGSVPLASRGTVLRANASVHMERHASKLVETHRTARRAELPDRRRRVNVSFDLQSAALAKRRSELTRAAAPVLERGSRRDIAKLEIAALKREQAALSGARENALWELDGAPDRIAAGSTRFLVHVLALPPPADSDIEQMDERVEAVAVRIAAQAEVDRGAEVQDVSNPENARAAGLSDWPGFDLLSRYPDGRVRSIEVKGRAGRSAVRMELNEWKQACNLRERYWLYVVFCCATSEPRLYRVQDPFRSLLASENSASAFTITAGNIVNAADTGSLLSGTYDSGAQTPTIGIDGGKRCSNGTGS